MGDDRGTGLAENTATAGVVPMVVAVQLIADGLVSYAFDRVKKTGSVF